MTRARSIFWLLCSLLLLFCAGSVRAADVEVQASLNPAEVEAGEQAQYQISVQGSGKVEDPPTQISVDGLTINYVGPQRSSRIQIVNGRMTSFSGVNFQYLVTPNKSGSFTIPEQTICVDGRTYKTNPVTLQVGGGQAGTASTPGDTSFAEIVLGKDTAYVGEGVPAEIRVYLDARMQWRVLGAPNLTGEGFTTTKIANPVESQETRNGRQYHKVVFSTAITPAKSGDISVGPLDMKMGMRRPQQQRRRRSHDPFEDFQDFFNMPDPFDRFGPEEAVQVSGVGAHLQVKPLPKEGRPASFSGAVGDFTMESDASPLRVKAGDPITMRFKISGRGDFDRVSAPVLVEDHGWRGYKPSSEFKPEDNLGLSGRKQFEMAVIPELPRKTLPRVEFSYFDPYKEKYVTLTAEQKPIQVEGSSVATGETPDAAQSSHASAETSATPEKVVSHRNDILYIRTDSGKWGGDLRPLYQRRSFWLVQLVPMGVLLAFAAAVFLRGRMADQKRVAFAKWQREKSSLRRTVEDANSSRADFLDAAARLFQGEAATENGRLPASLHAAEVCSARKITAETGRVIESIFAAREELQYAGRGSSSQPAGSEERESVLRAIKEYEQSPRA